MDVGVEAGKAKVTTGVEAVDAKVTTDVEAGEAKVTTGVEAANRVDEAGDAKGTNCHDIVVRCTLNSYR